MTEKTLGQIAEEAREQFTEKATMSQYSREADLLACMWDFIAQAVIEAHEARKWQPIESAPRDGAQMYVDAPQLDCGCSIAYFENGAWCSAWDGRKFIDYVPTKWQPLPAPPKQGD